MKKYIPNTTFLRLLIYGDPGAGKTTFLGSGGGDERCNPVLWLDAGGNPESIRRNKHQPTTLVMESISDLNPVYAYLNAGQPSDHPFAKELVAQDTFPGPFKMLVIDGLTEIQRIMITEIAGAQNAKPGDRLGKGTTIPEWGVVLRGMVNIVSLYYKLPLHVCFTALEGVRQDKLTGVSQYTTMFQGQSKTEVASFALAVGRFVRLNRIPANAIQPEWEKAYSVLFFDPVGKSLCKEQYGGIPASMPNPTMSQLLDVIVDDSST